MKDLITKFKIIFLRIFVANLHKLSVLIDLSLSPFKNTLIISIRSSWGIFGYNPTTSKEASIAFSKISCN